MLGRALTSAIWGVVADRYGRKPVIIIGVAAVYVNFRVLFVLPEVLILGNLSSRTVF